MRKPDRPSDKHSGCGGLCVWAGLSVCVFPLGGCAASLVADIVSIGTSGKSVTDHGLDMITGQNCNLVQAVFRSDHTVCAPREAEVTHDPKELSDPGIDLYGSLGSGLNGEPGGPSGSASY